jgi:hypothetical protein
MAHRAPGRHDRGLSRAAPQGGLPRAIVVAALLFGMVQVSGCTAVGFMAGAGYDVLNNDQTPERFRSLAPGSVVTLRLNDGSKLRGLYVGTGALGPEGGTRAESATTGNPASRLEALAGAGLPPPVAVRVMVGTEEHLVPLSAIAHVAGPAPRGGKVFFTLLGLGLDVLIVMSFDM